MLIGCCVLCAELLKRSQEKKEERDKERLTAYYKKNFKVSHFCKRAQQAADIASAASTRTADASLCVLAAAQQAPFQPGHAAVGGLFCSWACTWYADGHCIACC